MRKFLFYMLLFILYTICVLTFLLPIALFITMGVNVNSVLSSCVSSFCSVFTAFAIRIISSGY